MPLQKYKTDIQQYQENTRIDSGCNYIKFVNANVAGVIKINNFPLAAGRELEIPGNAGEVDVTEYRIDFGTPVVGVLWVIKKIYIK